MSFRCKALQESQVDVLAFAIEFRPPPLISTQTQLGPVLPNSTSNRTLLTLSARATLPVYLARIFQFAQ